MNLTSVATFTKNTGQVATGLALADIDLYLSRSHRDTGVVGVVWDGTQNPTVEVTNIGKYIRVLAGADLDIYNYHLAANYTGITVLDSDWAIGSVGKTTVLAAGAQEWPYIVQTAAAVLISGADVWVTTDIAGVNIIWRGTTDALGAARDIFDNQPLLDLGGPYYFWRQHDDHTFDNPDTETVV